MQKSYQKIIPASYLVLIRDNKILLLRRYNTGYEDGNYSMVAGHVDEGESFSQCIIRESKEEAGIILSPEDLKVVHIFHWDSKTHKNNERFDMFFLATKWEGKIKNREPHKCDDLSWFDLDNLPKNIIPHIKRVLESIKINKFYDESGWD